MNKIFLLLLVVMGFVGVCASEHGHLPPRLHEQLGLYPEMSISSVCDSLGFALSDFETRFQLRLDDPDLDRFTLAEHDVSLDDVYQYFTYLEYGFDDFTTLGEVALIIKVPLNELVKYLRLNPLNDNSGVTIREARAEALDILDIMDNFNENTLEFLSTIILLGMGVVFVALIVTSVIISQSAFFSKKTEIMEKPAVAQTAVGEISTVSADYLREDDIAAVIAVIHKLKMDHVSETKIMLTWKRANVTMWRASGKIEMPTSKYNIMKRR
jgi:Na+-transporting methylmalonyl-CoA/oxaloacetate decarboxylase gamma subunit